MDKLNNLSKMSIAAVVAAILIIIAIIVTNGRAANPNNTDKNSTTTNSVATTPTTNAALDAAAPTQTTPSKPSGIAAVATKKPVSPQPNPPEPATPVIHFITPVKNDLWKIATQDDISWNNPGGISGSISLIDAATGQFIGTILPQVGPNQTSYAWNTRDLLLNRTSPLGKDVVPGTYEIRLSYDGNDIAPINSPAFTIMN